MSNGIRIGLGIGSGDVFWVQVKEAIYHRSLQHLVELIPISQSNFFSAFTADDRTALLEEIVAQELDVLLGWSFPESLAYAVLDMGIPIVHLFETIVEHPLSVSPVGLQNIAEELAHYLAKCLRYKGNVLVIGGGLQDELPDDGRSRVVGVRNAFEDYFDIQFHYIPTDWSPEQAHIQITAELEAWQYPIDGIFGFSDALALVGQQVALELGRWARR